jgi:hypothetical protein
MRVLNEVKDPEKNAYGQRARFEVDRVRQKTWEGSRKGVSDACSGYKVWKKYRILDEEERSSTWRVAWEGR